MCSLQEAAACEAYCLAAIALLPAALQGIPSQPTLAAAVEGAAEATTSSSGRQKQSPALATAAEAARAASRMGPLGNRGVLLQLLSSLEGVKGGEAAIMDARATLEACSWLVQGGRGRCVTACDACSLIPYLWPFPCRPELCRLPKGLEQVLTTPHAARFTQLAPWWSFGATWGRRTGMLPPCSQHLPALQHLRPFDAAPSSICSCAARFAPVLQAAWSCLQRSARRRCSTCQTSHAGSWQRASGPQVGHSSVLYLC